MQKTLIIGAIGALLVLLTAPAAAQDPSDEPAPETTEAQSTNPSFEDLQKDLESFGDIEIGVSSKSLVVSWQGIGLGPTISSWLRSQVDGIDGSDADGVISAEEADSAEAIVTALVQKEFSSYAHQQGAAGHLMIDVYNPESARVNTLVADGIEGAVDSEDGILVSFVTSIAFPTRAADVHTVKLDMGKYYFRAADSEKAEDLVGDFSLTIKGNDGWSIDASSIQPGCAADKFAEGEMVFTAEDVNCFTERSGVLMGFSISGGDDEESAIPGFGSALWVGALAAAGILWRRRQ